MKDRCEGELTEAECKKALETMKSRKTPGNDGLTVDFYRKFWDLIKELLIDSLNMSYNTGKLTCSQRQAVIILLDKGKDRTLLKNWRPISLLNNDYKIASKAIAERLKATLPTIIHKDQVGYIKGRNIVDNIRVVEDIMYYTNKENISGILMAIDFEKAFDSCSWKFLELTLKKFNLGDSFVQWIKTFDNEAMSCVSNNGHTSNYFRLGRGVRQGDPLSPYLFLLVVEVLANVIRQDSNIKGITVSGEHIKLLQYADDTNGVVADTKSADRFLKDVYTFGIYTGLHLNKDKTEAMWLGKSRNSNSKPLGISWSKRPMKVLGVYCSYDESECNKLNFETRVNKCKSVLNEWKSRHLTMIGRAQILKTFIVSQFLFIASAIVLPKHYISVINNMMIDFMWRGKKGKLSRSVLYKTVENGGLGVPELGHMISVSHIKWVRRYIFDENVHYWKVFFMYFFRKCQMNVNVLLFSNYDTKRLFCYKNNIPLFYINIVQEWCHNVETKIPRCLFIWYNKDIMIDNKPFFIKTFYEMGIRYVGDLIHMSGKVVSFETYVKKGLPKSNWLLWNSLCTAVKSLCSRVQIQAECTVDQDMKFYVKNKEITKCTSKNIYRNVSGTYGTTHEGRAEKYIKDIDIEITCINWQEIYSRPSKLIQDVNTRDFQFRFLHDILINKYWLFKWKIVDNDKCRWCKLYIEDLYHIFWDCQTTKKFWSQFDEYFKAKLGETLDVRDVFFGSSDELLCCLIFIAKKHLYNCIYQERTPNFVTFLNNVSYVKRIELEIAKKSLSIGKWEAKWIPLM